MSGSVSTTRRARIWFMRRCPRLYIALSRGYNSFLWQGERRGWLGRLDEGTSQTSVLFFSYYRCGSMFLSRALRELAVANRLIPIDYCSFFGKVRPDQRGRRYEADWLEHAFRPTGCYFGVLRASYPIPRLDEYRTVVLLRDPRDCLTSHYYSIRDSHTLNHRGHLEARREAQAADIDSWVLQQADQYRDEFEKYHRDLVGRPNVMLLRYEDMIKAFPQVIEQVVEHTGLTGNRAVTERIVEEADFEVSSETSLAHKRSVRPGNHIDKLKPGTVERLNEKLRTVLDLYGYPLEVDPAAG